MIDINELNVEIARLEYEPSSYENYMKLASLYIIRGQLDGEPTVGIPATIYMEGASDEPQSEFARAIQGKPFDEVVGIIEDLLDTLSVTNPRVYGSVMRRIDAIE